MLDIGSRREVFWDDYLVDSEQTTSVKQLHHPIRRERVFDFDMPWEGDGCINLQILEDNGTYRMYYPGYRVYDKDNPKILHEEEIRICCAESRDGIHWERPNLGICEYRGIKETNILHFEDYSMNHRREINSFFVLKDTNPCCKEDERYKAVVNIVDQNLTGAKVETLWCMLSTDGIHFRKGWELTDMGLFDALNLAVYNESTGKYLLYIRDFHDAADNNTTFAYGRLPFPEQTRDIRWLESDDFKTWTPPVQLDFKGSDDYALYENLISKYYRAHHMFIGFPTRYVERALWTSNYDRLCDVSRRKRRFNIERRFGLATTDCLFMCSRDGKSWDRFDEAFMRPGKESEWGWVYGDCYPAWGMIETLADVPGEDPDLSMYSIARHMSGQTSWLYRYTLRVDGFVSRSAGYEPCKLVTKPFVFTGKELEINFETSAKGYLLVEILDKNCRPLEGYRSCELFGDSIKRIVDFDEPVQKLEGRPVRLKITMSDADIYSLKFN